MSRLSTHVLDTSKGLPASKVTVSLRRSTADANWTEVAQGVTDGNGRLEFASPLEIGTYQLRFATLDYFNQQSIFPFIEIAFQVKDGSKLHIPLLVSPYGYTTYRGS